MGRKRKEPEKRCYARLEIKKPSHKDKFGNWLWLCECSCGSGKKVLARIYDLKRGHVASCGCLYNEMNGRRAGRNSSLIADRIAGMKMIEIVKKYKVTRQRAYQILRKYKDETQVSLVRSGDGKRGQTKKRTVLGEERRDAV